MQTIGAQLYDTLVGVNPKVELEPALAESWEVKPGAKEWVFKLRKGVTFHNGKEMKAEDVVASITYHSKPDSKSGMRALMRHLDEVRATNPYEVTIRLKNGDADLPYLLAEERVAIAPAESVEKGFGDGIGTGVFVLESYDPGVRLRAKRNPNDWQTNRGYVDSLELLTINNPSARLNALLSDAIHLANRIEPNSVATVEKSANHQIYNIASGAHSLFAMGCDMAPFDNLDLRLALKYATDRNAIVRLVARGYGKIANDHPIASFVPFAANDIPQRPYDPDKASFHYKKSGHSGPIVCQISETTFVGAVEAAQVMSASAKKAGIDIQVNRVPADGYWDKVWRKVPLCGSRWAGRPTVDIMLSSAYSSTAPFNDARWKNPKFDQLLEVARAELDNNKRGQMYHDAQLMVHEDAGSLIPLFENIIDGGSKKVKGLEPSPLADLSRYRGLGKVWFD
ncbi:MAG: ABC transporter substrate-binding protein [Pseudorhodoplanes sp.]